MTDSPSSPAALPDFTPVPRKTITHGWTVPKQRDFIAALAASGSVRLATDAVGMSHCGVYKLRTAPGGESFARAWDAAVSMGAARVRDVLMDQAINGIPEEVVVDGKTIASRRRFNHRTMIWVLQHHMPDVYPGGSTINRADANGRAKAFDPRRPWEREEDPEALRALVEQRLDRLAQSLARDAAEAGSKFSWDDDADERDGAGG